MTNEELIAKIKAEIERLKDENNNIRCDSNKAYCQGYGDAFVDLLPFLDSLESEKPMNQDESVKYKNLVINSLREKRVFPTLKGEQLHKFKNEVNTLKQILRPWQTYGNIQSELFEQFALAFAVWGGYSLNFQVQNSELEDSRDSQNQERLEEEINKAMKSDLCPEEISDYDFCCIARHFAQWGAEHLADDRKMTRDVEDVAAEKAREYALSLPGGERTTAVGSTYSESGYYHGFVDGSKFKSDEKSFIENLDEAAEKSLRLAGFHNMETRGTDWKGGFIDGAKWDREQMMKEAVEGVVCYGSKGAYIETDFLGEYNTDVYGNPGDKVRVIIVKE